MPLGGAAMIGAGALGSGIAGMIASQGQTDAATAGRQQALQQWLKINVPDPAQQAIELQKYKVTGKFSPALQTAFQQSQTGLKNMQIDPTSRAAEVQALTQMQDIGRSGGMDAQALQKEQQAINAANTNEQGQRGAIVQNFAARGVGGAGAELAAQLQASQGDANQAAATGLSASADAQQRALQAMTSASNIGSNLNNQDYTQAKNAAEAQDAINRFNTQNSQNVSNANIGAQNDAQKYNLGNEQDIANRNTGVDNTQETHNKGLYQQQFDNQVRVASGQANAAGGVADQANANANRTAGQWAGIGDALAQGGAAYGEYKNNQKQPDNSEE